MSKRKSRGITADSTVYLAGAGWRYSDASMGCIATTAKKAESECFKQMREEAKTARDDDWNERPRPTIASKLSEIAYYGVHAEKLRDIVSERSLSEKIRDLNEDGYTYPDY